MISPIKNDEVLERNYEYREDACTVEALRILLVPGVANHALHELEVRKKNGNLKEGQDYLHVDLCSVNLQYRNQCKSSGNDQNWIDKHHQQNASVKGEAFAEEILQIDATDA